MKEPLRKCLRLSLVCNVCLLLLVLYLGWTGKLRFSRQSEPTFGGLPSIPALAIKDIEHAASFEATLERKIIGAWKVPIDSVTGRAVIGAKPTPYLLLYLRKTNGQHVAIYEENPGPKYIASVSIMQEGHRYYFPAALLDTRG